MRKEGGSLTCTRRSQSNMVTRQLKGRLIKPLTSSCTGLQPGPPHQPASPGKALEVLQAALLAYTLGICLQPSALPEPKPCSTTDNR